MQAFQARTARAPEQVLRYCSQAGAAPLWLSTQHVPSPGDVPPCPHCGAARAFEFQVRGCMAHENALLVQLHECELVVADGNDRFRVVACLASQAMKRLACPQFGCRLLVLCGQGDDATITILHFDLKL